jgi:hypothetical protein
MGVKFTNNASAELASSVNTSQTTIVVAAGQGAKFPSLGAGDFFYATLVNPTNNLEIVKVTARSTDTLTVVRAQDNTTAKAYNAGDRIELRPTAAAFGDLSNAVDTKAPINSPVFTGVPAGPTAAPGTNTTQLATTAFTSAAITAATGSLGTMATQNANSVSITGGSVTGITDLAVADGGTGASSFTANNVLLGNGALSFQTVAPAANGNVLTSNGTTWASAALPASALGVNGQVFTGNGTFTIPAGVTRLKVTVVGGGGGGCNGGGFGQNAVRGGGGGGGAAIKYLTGMTPGNTLAVTVGAGGTANSQPGGNGGNSTVSSGTQTITTITGAGGEGGPIDISTFATGGLGTNGDLNIRGSGGESGSAGGKGGDSILGGGGATGGTAPAGGAYGGGGTSLFNGVGSVGAAGVVIFEW